MVILIKTIVDVNTVKNEFRLYKQFFNFVFSSKKKVSGKVGVDKSFFSSFPLLLVNEQKY
jgi:isopenicillin N synthase-like dioxygenase